MPITLESIQEQLRRESADGWLLYGFRDQNPISLAVSGLTSAGSRRWFLWIPARGRPEWIVQAIERTTFLDLPAELAGKVHLYVGWRDLAETLGRTVRAAGRTAPRVLMEHSPGGAVPTASRVDAGTLEMVRAATGAEILSSADAVQLVLARITPAGMEGHRRAAAVCSETKDAAFALIAERLRAGRPVSEREVQLFIAQRFAQAGMEASTCIVAVNRNAADPHYAPDERHSSPIQRGDMVLIDLWTREAGDPGACYADITWTAYCGDPVPPAARAVFDVVREGRDRAVALVRQRRRSGSDVHGYEVDDACRGVVAAAGYGEAFFHRTGHSLGSAVHFVGANIDNLETRDRRTLLPGLLFTIEPGIYLPELDFDASGTPRGLGIRSEIDCFVREDDVEITTGPVQTEVLALAVG